MTAVSEPPARFLDPDGSIAPEVHLRGLSDHALLVGMVADQRRMNRAEAARLAKVAELRRRREADYEARKAAEPHFTLTPLREIAVEVAPLLGHSEGKVAAELRGFDVLEESFPRIFGLVTAGQLDLYRARIVSDAAEQHLTDPAAVAALAKEMGDWFDRHLAGKGAAPDGGEPLVTMTVKQIRNRVDYLVRKLRPKDADERFRNAFARRDLRVDSTGDGMGQLWLSHDVVSLRAVEHRLNLLARQLRRDGDSRTLKQLRTDLAADLLLGRLTVGASTGELEEP